MIESTINGTNDLLKALKQFPQNIQKNVMTGAVRAGCKPLVEAARRNVPVDTGNLKKSIGINKRKVRDKTKLRFSVSPRRLDSLDFKGLKEDKGYRAKVRMLQEQKKAGGFYAHMIEFGTSKMPAQPFMRPAFENQDNQSIEAAKEYMAKRIDKEVEKAKNGRS